MARVRMATINALGHSHTKPGGNAKKKWAPAPARTRMLIRIILKRRYGVIGVQEFQELQKDVFKRAPRANPFGLHDCADNAVIWLRPLYKKIGEGYIEVPYFDGDMKKMPWVILQKRSPRKKNRKVFGYMSTHNPANVRGPAEQWRREGWQNEKEWAVRMVEGRQLDGAFVTGDKNDKDYGKWVREHGGQTSHFPQIRGIDWIAGWGDFVFLKGKTTYSRLNRKMSDHPITEAVAKL